MKKALIVLLLTGCTTVGPDYKRQEMPLPEKFSGPADPAEAGVPADWWTLYSDPVLNDLVAAARRAEKALDDGSAKGTLARWVALSREGEREGHATGLQSGDREHDQARRDHPDHQRRDERAAEDARGRGGSGRGLSRRHRRGGATFARTRNANDAPPRSPLSARNVARHALENAALLDEIKTAAGYSAYPICGIARAGWLTTPPR